MVDVDDWQTYKNVSDWVPPIMYDGTYTKTEEFLVDFEVIKESEHKGKRMIEIEIKS